MNPPSTKPSSARHQCGEKLPPTLKYPSPTPKLEVVIREREGKRRVIRQQGNEEGPGSMMHPLHDCLCHIPRWGPGGQVWGCVGHVRSGILKRQFTYACYLKPS